MGQLVYQQFHGGQGAGHERRSQGYPEHPQRPLDKKTPKRHLFGTPRPESSGDMNGPESSGQEFGLYSSEQKEVFDSVPLGPCAAPCRSDSWRIHVSIFLPTTTISIHFPTMARFAWQCPCFSLPSGQALPVQSLKPIRWVFSPFLGFQIGDRSDTQLDPTRDSTPLGGPGAHCQRAMPRI